MKGLLDFILTSKPELLKEEDGKLKVKASFQMWSAKDFFEKLVFFFLILFPFWIK